MGFSFVRSVNEVPCYVLAEKNASELVTRLLEMSEKARKTEELLEQMERERWVDFIDLYFT